MSEHEHDRIHQTVREGYARAASGETGCCGGDAGSAAAAAATAAGYDEQDLAGPAAAGNLGLGCGNPTALARLEPGERVLDLGSGAGFDAMLAAPRLGPTGRFIGVDMTPEMLERARTNAVNAGLARTVEFREGKIEQLPVVSQSVDVVISNCVINLSPDKPRVFREAFRVLRPGGRLAVSDIVLSEPLPKDIAALSAAWVACVGGALTEERYLAAIRDAGFVDVRIEKRSAAPMLEATIADPTIAAIVASLDPARLRAVAETVFSASIEARRP